MLSPIDMHQEAAKRATKFAANLTGVAGPYEPGSKNQELWLKLYDQEFTKLALNGV